MSKCFKHISSVDDKLEILKNSKALIKNDSSMSKNDSLVQAAEQLLNQYSEQEQQIIQYVLDNKPVEIKGSDELVAQVEKSKEVNTPKRAIKEKGKIRKVDDIQKQIQDAEEKEKTQKIAGEIVGQIKEESAYKDRAIKRQVFTEKHALKGAAFAQSLINNDYEKAVDDLYRNRISRDIATEIFEDAKTTGLLSDQVIRKVQDELNSTIEVSESELNEASQSSNDQANTNGQKTSQSDTFDPLKIKNTQTQPNTKGGFKLIDTDTGKEVFEGRSFKTKSEGNKLLKKMQQEALNGPEKKAMFSKALSETIEDFSTKVKNDLGLKAFHVFETNNGNIELSSIIVNKDEQRNGKGTEALDRLIDYADSVGKTIVLTPGLPNDSHGTTSRARLVKFYKRFGFVESKGRNIDYAIGAGKMYREAQKTKFSKALPKNIDNEYLAAVERGDMETAQRLVNEAAEASGYGLSDYQMEHQAPDKESGYSINDLTQIYPDDIYSSNAVRYYGDGQPQDSEAISKLQKYRNKKPTSTFYVYRAVPKALKETVPRNGDWVSTTRGYAEQHGKNYLTEGYKVIAYPAMVKDVFTDGNSIHELGYDDGKVYAYSDTKNNRKLLDPITYDDNGDVIPLSKRFNKRADDTRFSNDTASKADTKITGSTVEQVNSWLPNRVNKLVDKGIINVVQSIKDIPESVEGFYEPATDKLYLIADSLSERNINSVLAHELFHRALVVDPKLKSKVDSFKDYFFHRYMQASKGLGSSIENMAYKRIINADTPMEDRAEEFMAYMVSEYMRNPNMLVLKMKRAIERFIGHVRAILIRSGLDLGFIKELTPADLSAMAMRYGTSTQRGYMADTKAGTKQSITMPQQITNVAEQGDAWLKGFLSQANKDTAIYNLQDRFIDLKRQIERVVKEGGEIAEEENPYLAEELYHQKRQSRIDDFYADEVQPILNTMHDKGIGIKELEEFLHARHAPSRNKVMAERNPSQEIIDQKIEEAEQELERLVGENAKSKEINAAERELRKWQGAEAFYGTEEQRLSLSGMSDESAADYMDSLTPQQLEEYESLGDAIDKINNDTLDLLIDYGLETDETVQVLKDLWEHYVPLHRDEAHPEQNTFGHPVGKGFSVSGTGMQQATGSNADVTNIMAHIMAAREQMITRGEKNKVSIALAEFIKEHPDKDFAEVNKLETHKKLIDGLVEDVIDPFFVQKARDNVVTYRENGKDRLIVFNEKHPENIRLALSLKNMDGVELDKVESIIGKGTRWLASVNTQYNLVFGIFNLMRDTQGMALNLESTALHGKQKQVLSLMPTAIKTIFNITRGGNSDPRIAKLYDDFRHDGGTTGFVQMFDTIEKRSQSLQKELDIIGAGKTSKSWHWIVKAISDFNTIMENGTRFATYMSGRNAGLSRMESASLSKNITVNFNRKGAYTTKLGAFYAFFNASMQGTLRTVETLSSDKGKQIMAGGVALGAITTLIGLAAMGDDDWEKIPEFVRERSLIIPTGKKTYVSIPMPLGFHILPNIGRKFVESFLGSDRVTPQQRLLALAGSTVGAFNPLGGSDISGAIMPTVMDPALALWRNKDWTGKPVYREDYNSLKPTPGFTRTKDSATWGAKATAELINKATGGTDAKQGLWSPTPDQIDYLIGQIAGGTGREIMKAEQVVESAFTGEELPTYKVPLIGRLIGSTGDGAVEATAYYDNLKRLNEHKAEIKYLKENGNARDVISYTQDNPEVKMLGFATSVEKTIDRMKKQRRVLISRGGSSKAIDQAINAQMKKLNDNLLAK